ncbi:MAG: hypothetical protein O3B84_02975 [Chloroflexi bacterium]|nr:hypothetical protein [Chloroflexota bacterium]
MWSQRFPRKSNRTRSPGRQRSRDGLAKGCAPRSGDVDRWITAAEVFGDEGAAVVATLFAYSVPDFSEGEPEREGSEWAIRQVLDAEG